MFEMLNLRLFDEGEGGEGSDAGVVAESTEGTTPPDVGQAPSAEEFDRLVKGDYKKFYDERVQSIINKRFKESKTLEQQYESLNPVFDVLEMRYGIDVRQDPAKALELMNQDTAYLEEEAMKRNVPTDVYMDLRKTQVEKERLERMITQTQKQQAREQMNQVLGRQAEATKAVYPNFDLVSEITHPEYGERFKSLLKSNVDVKTAYEVIHKDDIIGGAMQYTAQQVEKKVVDNVRARGARPAENGSGGSSAASVKKIDPAKMTKEQREEISRRVLMGERVEF